MQTEDTRAGATVIALVIILYGFCRRVILSAFFGLLALDLAWIEETQGYAVTTLARSGGCGKCPAVCGAEQAQRIQLDALHQEDPISVVFVLRESSRAIS